GRYTVRLPMADPLAHFQPAVRDWFRASFAGPTPPQALGWPVIARGDSALLLAPTGSGKTLAAFLACIDGLMFAPPPPRERRFRREPADILITTPESLYLLLTSNAREALRSVETVIVDEIHALVPTKRGAHL